MGAGQVVGQFMLIRRCGDNEELVEFKWSVFCHMLHIIPVLCTVVISRLSFASAYCSSLSREASNHSGFYFCK